MRKRMLTGVLILGAANTILFFLTIPGENSVGYHKRKYFEARDGSIWVRSARHILQIFGKLPPGSARTSEDDERMESHRRALIKLGYLAERSITVRNQDPSDIVFRVMRDSQTSTTNQEFPLSIGSRGGSTVNCVVITSVAEDMPKWEKLVKAADNCVMLPGSPWAPYTLREARPHVLRDTRKETNSAN